MANNNINNATHNQSNVEVLIAEEILADEGIIKLNERDVKKLRDGSDFMDGTVIDGKLDDLGELAAKAINSLKEAHPQDTLTYSSSSLFTYEGFRESLSGGNGERPHVLGEVPQTA